MTSDPGTLLREIQASSTSSGSDVATILRQCQVLAKRLGLTDMGDWVRFELNGYPDDEELPDYRVIPGQAYGHFIGAFGRQLRNGTIPASCLPEKLRDWAEVAYLRQPVATIQQMATERHGESLQFPWPGDLVAMVQGQVYSHMNLMQAWLSVSPDSFQMVVEAVRNRVLALTLELEDMVPSSGETPGSGSQKAMEQVFHTHIYGSVTNFAQGSEQVSQSATVVPGDIPSLVAALRGVGVPEDALEDLEESVRNVEDEATLRERLADWSGRLFGGIVKGAGKASLEVVTKVVPRLIEQFLSNPPAM